MPGIIDRCTMSHGIDLKTQHDLSKYTQSFKVCHRKNTYVKAARTVCKLCRVYVVNPTVVLMYLYSKPKQRGKTLKYA